MSRGIQNHSPRADRRPASKAAPPVFVCLALGLVVSIGCGDLGGKRRNASGSVAGTGLVGSDVDTLAAGPAQQTGTQGTPASAPAPIPGTVMPAAQPGGAAVPSGEAPAPGGAAATVQPTQQPGFLPGLPGVNLPGQPQPNVVTEKAQVGATGKGNYGGPGVVTTPISVYFQAQERLIYDSVTYAVKLFEAEHGYKPKTEEEFMKQVIEANQIRLPQLPPGSKYKYDPQSGELQVEHPQR
ncbi:MAG TPA: hypothetical protein VFI31_21860 [Pirellulales bacterium]|nr:hypothetical protein [Pirellulales bacterium]